MYAKNIFNMNIHESEYALAGEKFDLLLNNNGSIEELERLVLSVF